jgi:acetyl-CoA carboxylase biotin carboxyl carrier protein
MNQKEIKELIEFLVEKDIAEFELERGDVKVRVKRGATVQYVAADPGYAAPPAPAYQEYSAPQYASPPVAAAAAAGASPGHSAISAAAEPAPEAGLHIVRSPIVGTFYEAPSPGAPPFVKVGDAVEVGQVLCIIEAMKLMNEIEAEVAGEIVKRYVNNAQPVEYGQELFAIKARA